MYSLGGAIPMLHDPWLDRWIPELKEATSGSPLLEIGCGAGEDTKVLVSHGLEVVAFDLSHQQAAKARAAAPDASISVQNVLDPFPLEGTGIGAVVASLSLHYFTWEVTQSLVRRIHGTLRPGGLFLGRFNSTEDSNYGATGNPEVEPGLSLVEDQTKRFFSQASVKSLFGQGWRVRSMEHMVIHKYQLPKAIWEVAAASAA